MKKHYLAILVTVCGIFTAATFTPIQDQEANDLQSLAPFMPENYDRYEPERCINCKTTDMDIMHLAVGVKLEDGKLVRTNSGWLDSAHAFSMSHENINTACAWCHGPFTAGVTKDKEAAAPIKAQSIRGVTCSICHPSSVPLKQRRTLVINYNPGLDPESPDSYIWHDISGGKALNDQCTFCHHEYHDMTVEIKAKMLEYGDLRCIDCHMAGYTNTESLPKRFHDMKVEKHLPYSCSGEFGTASACHAGENEQWYQENIKKVKGPQREW